MRVSRDSQMSNAATSMLWAGSYGVASKVSTALSSGSSMGVPPPKVMVRMSSGAPGSPVTASEKVYSPPSAATLPSIPPAELPAEAPPVEAAPPLSEVGPEVPETGAVQT